MSEFIVDFDGTLIYQNSSRILEKEIYRILPLSFKKKIIYFIYFSFVSLFFDLCFIVIWRFFVNKRDVRFIVFLYLTFDFFKNNQNIVFQNCLSKISVRTDLYDKKDHLTIASLGLDTFIQYIVDYYKIPVKSIFASSLNEKWLFQGKTYQDKIKFLATYPSFEYVTDDLNEYHKLTKMIDNVEQNKKDWNLIFSKRFYKK